MNSKYQKIIFLLLCVFFFSSLYGQHPAYEKNKFKEASAAWDKFSFGFGVRHAQFLNQTYFDNRQSDQITGGLDLSFGIRYTKHPLTFEGHFVNNGFEVDAIANGGDDKPIGLVGFETGIQLALLPQSSVISPFVGGGYFFGFLALDSDEAIDGRTSRLSLNNPYASFGLLARYKLIVVQLDYRRIIGIQDNQDRAFYQYGLSLFFNFSSLLNSL